MPRGSLALAACTPAQTSSPRRRRHGTPSGSPTPLGQNHIASDSILSMESSFLSVREASARLGVTAIAVRQQIAAGRLPAVKRGRDWWLDAQAIERIVRQRPGGGRPLSPTMAWAVLLLASGQDAVAKEVAGRDRYWSRVRTWLRDHALAEHAPRLRARAQVEQLDAHPSELKRILDRPDVLATGSSAADTIGLVGAAAGIEAYAPAGRRDAIIGDHALMPGPGPVLVRWVPDEIWPHLVGHGDRRAPRAAVLLDLLESDDPRARREAARALAS